MLCVEGSSNQKANPFQSLRISEHLRYAWPCSRDCTRLERDIATDMALIPVSQDKSLSQLLMDSGALGRGAIPGGLSPSSDDQEVVWNRWKPTGFGGGRPEFHSFSSTLLSHGNLLQNMGCSARQSGGL